MEPTTDIQSVPEKVLSTRLEISDVPDSKVSLLESTAKNNRNVRETSEKENGLTKLSPLNSARPRSDPTLPNLGSTNTVSCHVDLMDSTQSPQPADENKFTSEIYISPAPSISLCGQLPLSTKEAPSLSGGTDKAQDRSTTSSPFADTKAVLADRRSNFFSEVTRAPVLQPSSASHSSVLSFQPTANVFTDVKQPTCITANGHSEVSFDLVQPLSESGATPLCSPSEVIEPSNNSNEVSYVACHEPVVIVHQAAPPPDLTEVWPLVAPVSSPIVLEVDEDALVPQFCARMEPSPERFWGPSVTPARSSSNSLLLRGSERAGHVAELRLIGSTGQLEMMGGREGSGEGTGGDSNRLGILSSSSPLESPPTKGASKEPSSSTSTDSLPSTPSSANLSHPKSGNLDKLRTFFGDTAPKMFECKSDVGAAEPSSEPIAEGLIAEFKKTDLQKLPVIFDVGGKSTSAASSDRSFKNKKGGWSLSSKPHGTRSPGARPKKATERSDPGDSPKQKQTWRGKMARTILRYGSGPILSAADVAAHTETLGVIGVPLEICAPSPFNELVPLLVTVCTRIVEEKGLMNQGIYRVPGNTGAINQLIEEMTKDPAGLCLDSEKWQDVNLVSSLLKLFFRKLPDSLITDELYDSVIDANRLDNSTRRMLKLKKLLHELPEHNFETFHFLAQHLSRVASHEEVNKMDARNLAIVFGPTLVRPQDNNMVNMVRDMTDQCRIIENIILHCDWFFGSWDEDVNVPVDEDSEELVPISGMNDELLAKAESLAITHHVSNRDVIQMIIKAANRKLRSRGKAKLSGSDGDSGPYDGNLRGPTAAADAKAHLKLSLDSPPLCGALSEEVLLDVKKYPAYHFDEISFLSTENAKPQFRRAQSNDCLLDSSPIRIYYSDITIRPVQRRFMKPFVSLCSEDPCAVAEQDKENFNGDRRYYCAT